MAVYTFRKAQAKDNSQLLELVAAPMPGAISIAFRREPDYFLGARVQYEDCEVYVCENVDTHIVAVFSIGYRRLWVNGAIRRVRYFSDVRIHPRYRKSSVLYRLVRFIEEEKFLDGEIAQTIVFSSNEEVLRILRKTYRLDAYKYFNYFPYSPYVSYMIALGRARLHTRNRFRIRKATSSDLAAMQAFQDKEARNKQFYPAYNFGQLATAHYRGIEVGNYFLAFEEGELVGICALWDQKGFKQTLVADYSGAIKYARPLINLVGKFTGGFRLPKAGKNMNYASLYHILVRRNDPHIFEALVHHILQDQRRAPYHYLLCGLDGNDPLRKPLEKLSNTRIIEGKQFIISYEQALVDEIDDRIPYLEVARI